MHAAHGRAPPPPWHPPAERFTSPFRRHPVTLPATFGESGSTWRRMCSAVRSTCVCAHGARCSMVTVTRPARTGYGRPRPCGSPLPAPSRRNWDQVNAARTLSPTRQAASTAAASHGFASFFSGCQRRRGLPSRVMRTGSDGWISQAEAGGKLPPEYAAFGIRPRPWTTEHVLAIWMEVGGQRGALGSDELDTLPTTRPGRPSSTPRSPRGSSPIPTGATTPVLQLPFPARLAKSPRNQ